MRKAVCEIRRIEYPLIDRKLNIVQTLEGLNLIVHFIEDRSHPVLKNLEKPFDNGQFRGAGRMSRHAYTSKKNYLGIKERPQFFGQRCIRNDGLDVGIGNFPASGNSWVDAPQPAPQPAPQLLRRPLPPGHPGQLGVVPVLGPVHPSRGRRN